MLYPQNGDRVVTIDSLTSLHPVPHRRRRSNQERDTTRQRVVSAAGGLRCQEGSTECTALGGFDIVQLGPTDDHTPRCALQPGIRCAPATRHISPHHHCRRTSVRLSVYPSVTHPVRRLAGSCVTRIGTFVRSNAQFTPSARHDKTVLSVSCQAV